MKPYKTDSSVISLLDSAKSIVKFIDADLETLYMNHREQVGYQNVTVRLNDLLYTSANLVLDKRLKYEEGTNSYFALQNARVKYDEVKSAIDKFLREVYEPFRKEVEALKLSPFDNGER
jgi:tryptophanyl-tRNA synthetase